MTELLENIDLLYLGLVFVLGAIAFVVSTISGGGGALLLIPAINFMLGSTKAAPIINLGTFIGRPVRLVLFWKHIRWTIFWYYVPSALAGTFLAAYFFTKVKIPILQIIVALFLISTLFQYRFGKKERSFEVKRWYFIPLGFLVAGIGTITGGMGPILNPFYLNAGITKEDLVATKTANSFFVGVAQLGSYAFFGLIYGELWVYGISLGLGATVGNIIGKRLLEGMKDVTFRKWVIAIMVISGIVLLYRALTTL